MGQSSGPKSWFGGRQAGTSLRIVGLVPSLENNTAACDLLLQYQAARKDWSDGRTGKNSPHVRLQMRTQTKSSLHSSNNSDP